MNKKLYFASYIILSILFVIQITVSVGKGIGKNIKKPFYFPSPEVLQTTCTEPSGGCGTEKYFDYNSCECVNSSTTQSTCSPPDGGCPVNYHYNYTSCMCELDSGATCSEQTCPALYYWDQASCSCKIQNTTPCEPPSSGCPTNSTWNSSTCACQYSTTTCTTQTCASNYYWDQATCSCKYQPTNCTEPSGGCGINYYWDQPTCSCKYYSTTTCYPPTTGCSDNYYWDSYHCSCRPNQTTACPTPAGGCKTGYFFDYGRCACRSYAENACAPPSNGCGTNSYWDSYFCQCKVSSNLSSNCSPPTGGCPTNSYWDNYYCLCKTTSSTGGTCTAPSYGCGVNFFWDYSTCTCKPSQTTYANCSKPVAGCGSGYFWDYASCACKSNIQSSSCIKPSSGCQKNTYWDISSCSCKSYNQYYSATNFDRLANASDEVVSCVKLKLSPYEFDRFRFLIPSSSTDENELKNLNEKISACWDTRSTLSSTSTVNSPVEVEKCLIDSLGNNAYREIFEGKRKPSYEEHLIYERCNAATSVKKIVYKSSAEDLSQDTQDCLRSILPSNIYSQVEKGTLVIPYEYKDSIARCFGINPQPFDEGQTYTVPNEILSCLSESIGVERIDELRNGSEPSVDEKKQAEICFSKINNDQQNFLPPAVEQVPFIEVDENIVKLASVNQKNQKIKNKNLGGKVVFEGSSLPSSTVYIYIFSDPIVVTTKTDENGDWVYELEHPLTGEKHIAYAVSKDSTGKNVRSAVFDFTVIAAEADAVDTYINETKISEDVKKQYITYALVLLGIVGIGAILIYAFYYVRKIKMMKSKDDQVDINIEKDTNVPTKPPQIPYA